MQRSFVAAGVLLAAAWSAHAQTTVYSTSFETPNFNVGTLAGQSGWIVEPASAPDLNAVVQAGSANTGSQAVRINANPSLPSGGWAFYDPISINPLASNTPVVTVAYSMFVGTGSATSAGWGMDILASNVSFMARMRLAQTNTMLVEDRFSGFVNTGVTVTRNAWHNYRMVLDFSTNTYDVVLDNVVVADNFNFSSQNGIIGDFDFRNVQTSPASDFALFDDYSITVAAPAPAPIEWGNPLGGSWSTGSDWIGGVSPNSITAIAKLGTVISTPRTISLSGGTVLLDQMQITSPIGYTLTGIIPTNPWTLRFAGASTTALLVSAGSHEFNTDVLVDKDATFDLAAGTTVRFRQKFLTAGRAITKTGGGLMRVREIRGSSVSVDGGTLQLTAGGTFVGTSVFTTLNVGGGTLDIGSSLTSISTKLLVDYTGASPIQDLRGYLAAGKIIDSTNADARKAIGYAEASAIGLTQLDVGTSTVTPVDGTAILLRTVFKGDANLDLNVNLDDFTALAAAFGNNGVWSQGDFDYNGVVNLDDFTSLAANFGVSADLPRSVVPEPTTLGAIGIVLICSLRGSRRK